MDDFPADWGTLPGDKARVAVRGVFGTAVGEYEEVGTRNGQPCYRKITDPEVGARQALVACGSPLHPSSLPGNNGKGVLYLDLCGYWKVCQTSTDPHTETGWNHSQLPDGATSEPAPDVNGRARAVPGGNTALLLPCGAWTRARALPGEVARDYGPVRVVLEGSDTVAVPVAEEVEAGVGAGVEVAREAGGGGGGGGGGGASSAPPVPPAAASASAAAAGDGAEEGGGGSASSSSSSDDEEEEDPGTGT